MPARARAWTAETLVDAFPPMLATLTDAPFDRAGWIFEIKWDGYRILAGCSAKGRVLLASRKAQDFTDRYRAVADELGGLGRDAVVDGEVVVLDAEGMPSFQLLQQYSKTGEGDLAYEVFDLLSLDGEDLRARPLLERKELLRALVEPLAAVRFSAHVETDGTTLFRWAKGRMMEGVMAKRADARYVGRRSEDWLKVKTKQRQEVVICGFTAPRGGRSSFGALILGVYDRGELTYVGHTGGGFNDRGLKELHAKLVKLRRAASPFKKAPKTNMPATWVAPALVCEVAFQEWTSDGRMRQPIYIGMREDKDPKKVVRELPTAHAPATAGKPAGPALLPAGARGRKGKAVAASGRSATVSHPDKVYFPGDGITKGEVVDYYRAVSETILPYLRDRPMSLLRQPDGIGGEAFFQKDMAGIVPDWMDTYLDASESQGAIRYALCQDEAALVWLANLGCIELNPWNSRTADPERPDYCILDLDPGPKNGFADVVRTAKVAHAILEKAKVPHYPKTSGKRGLHVVIPLGARYTHDQSRQFAELLATMVHAKLPKATSLERSPSKRGGQLYLDFLQNRRSQTLAAAYCVRPNAGATVSAPLAWDEVTARLNPSKFTIRTMPKRLAKAGDLWAPVLGKGIDMEAALARLLR